MTQIASIPVSMETGGAIVSPVSTRSGSGKGGGATRSAMALH